MGQNSTQNPQPLHRSTVIATEPLAIGTLQLMCRVKRLHAACHLEITSPETPIHDAGRGGAILTRFTLCSEPDNLKFGRSIDGREELVNP